MKFSIDKQDKYTLLSLQEESLTAALAPDLKSEFVFLSNEGTANLILDLSGVKFIDSSGLSAILVADRLWKDLGSFVITGIVHPSVKKLIEITRLDTTLTIVPSLSEAIDFVFMEELQREIMAEGGDDEADEEEDQA
jgi:anti-anti-sigma factor